MTSSLEKLSNQYVVLIRDIILYTGAADDGNWSWHIAELGKSRVDRPKRLLVNVV
jgi:hypothetical protein